MSETDLIFKLIQKLEYVRSLFDKAHYQAMQIELRNFVNSGTDKAIDKFAKFTKEQIEIPKGDLRTNLMKIILEDASNRVIKNMTVWLCDALCDTLFPRVQKAIEENKLPIFKTAHELAAQKEDKNITLNTRVGIVDDYSEYQAVLVVGKDVVIEQVNTNDMITVPLEQVFVFEDLLQIIKEGC